MWLLCLVLVGVLGVAGQFQSHGAAAGCFPIVLGFGDDWGDSGNLQALYPSYLVAPDGMSYFIKPTRRFSDGRLMLDLLVQALATAPVSSYAVGLSSDLSRAVSFAVAGSGAQYFGERDDHYGLQLQLEWLMKFRLDLQEFGHDSDNWRSLPTFEALDNGLYVISTGLNDYRNALIRDRMSLLEADLMATGVVASILKAVADLLVKFGAKNVMVFNLPPLGCYPEFLTLFATPDVLMYDDMGCLITYNQVTTVHNELLKTGLDALRHASPKDKKIILVDMARVMTDILYDPMSHGFQEGLQACCGTGELYNFNPYVLCGMRGFVDGLNVTAGACGDPAHYVHWDGLHTTEAFNKKAVKYILTGPYTYPPKVLNCLFNFDGF